MRCELLKRAVRILEAVLTPRRRRVHFGAERLTLVRSVWWDDTGQDIFDVEIVPYFDALTKESCPRVILDAGAATGHFAVAAARRFPEASIVCFEPSFRQRLLLQRNARLNHVQRRVRIQREALWNKAGHLKFRTHGGISSLEAVGLLPRHLPFEETVRTMTLDDWCDDQAPAAIDLIKMDIEGAELEVLEGAARSLEKFRPELVIQAYHLRDGSRTLERCARLLGMIGYECVERRPPSGLLHARPALCR